MKPKGSLQLITWLIVGMAVFLCCPARARAELVVSLGPPLNLNSSDFGEFDVLLTNTGPSAVNIAGFTFEITTASPDIGFDGAQVGTVAPYIFAGNSLFGPFITVINALQDLSASDVAAIGSTTVAAGDVVALGHVNFERSATAPTETVDILLAGFPATSLSDENGNDIPIAALFGLQVNITGSGVGSVPEPSSLILLLTAGPVIWGSRRLRRMPVV